jgi:polysaccharide pyruvyl transferase WcaK-like protein
MPNYDNILDAAACTSVLTATHDHLDALMAGLAIFEAHAADDTEATEALLSSHTAGSALHSVLAATEALVEVLAIESSHNVEDLIAAMRLQALRHQARHGDDGSCPETP